MRALLFFAALLSSLQFAIALPAYAESLPNPNDPSALLEGTKLGGSVASESQRLPVLIGNIIKVALSLLGTIFVVLMVYAGFLWMTAAGNEEAVEKAKGIIKTAVIGLVIIILAYSITAFVVGSITRAVGP